MRTSRGAIVTIGATIVSLIIPPKNEKSATGGTMLFRLRVPRVSHHNNNDIVMDYLIFAEHWQRAAPRRRCKVRHDPPAHTCHTITMIMTLCATIAMPYINRSGP